ncbi:transporter substrate-binding domain-containing protein [Duganella sp. FT92W]|uniref:Transporter substrate-binding domain-containing protein n=1 Tax=Pseudoduganella rivuli TaxID=2666085 RepID=A0A7X2LU82_9BURK|nr:ABC transporter substrate-binding protein [Pseudoduganella rivuli]MRV75390.1 transporter substrate-binding domain-containing protein [Pseudoduganella rivuli]
MIRIPTALLTLCAFVHGAAIAETQYIVFIAPTNHTMPMAQFRDGMLVDGVLKNLGDLIARRMERRAVYVSVPSKRVSEVLSAGGADALCYVVPVWIDGRYNWTKPFINSTAIVAARKDAPVLKSVTDLAGKPIGTVIGYRYPELERLLGPRFVREDAPTTELNFRKLVVGRMQYATIDQIAFEYRMRQEPSLALRKDVAYATVMTQCAFSLHSKIPFAQAEHAIDALVQDGSIAAMLNQYAR